MAENTLIKAIRQDTELRLIAQELLTKYKENLTNMDAIATSNLRGNAETDILAEPDHIELDFILENYWQYLEQGPRPHFPPIKAIEDWIRIKNIKPAPRGKRKAPTVKQLAFAICKTMEKGKRDTDGIMKAYLARPAIRYMLEENKELVNRFLNRIEEIYIENFFEITESLYTIG